MHNLACYYAQHYQKNKMLIAMRRAVQLVRTIHQFIGDKDFKAYLDYAEFLAVFN